MLPGQGLGDSEQHNLCQSVPLVLSQVLVPTCLVEPSAMLTCLPGLSTSPICSAGPSALPFHELQNVVMSPHCGQSSDTKATDRIAELLAMLRHLSESADLVGWNWHPHRMIASAFEVALCIGI